MDNVDKVVYKCKIKGFHTQYQCGKGEGFVDKMRKTKTHLEKPVGDRKKLCILIKLKNRKKN